MNHQAPISNAERDEMPALQRPGPEPRPECPRILRLITRLNLGGPTRHVRLLMGGLFDLGFEQLLVHGDGALDEGCGLIAVPGERRRLSGLRRAPGILGEVQALLELKRLLKRERFALLHSHQGKAFALGSAAAARQIPHVHTFHGHTFEGYFEGVLLRAKLAIEGLAARRATALICQSISQGEDILRVLGGHLEPKLHLIPPAIDAEVLALAEAPEAAKAAVRERARAELGIVESARVLLFPARLVPIKRPELSLQSFAAMRGEPLLLVAGDGPLRADLSRLARELGISARLRWLGNRSDLPSLMLAADAVYLTSRMEGTPLALLEAAALARPIVGPAVGGVFDVLGEVAELLPKGAGQDAYAAALLRALDHRVPEESARKIRERHAPQGLLSTLSALYRRILGV